MFVKKIKVLIPIIAYFFSFQILIQGVDAICGVLIVRNLCKVDYAYFGMASTMAISIINVSIGGVGSYLVLEGVKLKHKYTKFSSLFLEVERFAANKIWIVIVFSLPIIFWLFLRNNLPTLRFLFFLPLIFIDVFLRVKMQLYQVTLNIMEKYNTIQLITLGGSMSRLFLILLFYIYPNGEIAYLGLVFSYIFQYYILTKEIRKYINLTETITNEHVPSLSKLYKSQLPLTIYNYVDAQLGIFILTFFGTTILLADVNAAGRLNVILVSVNAFINNFVIVQFSKINNMVKFAKLLLFTSVFFIVLYGFGIMVIIAWPEWFIWIIGKQYSNLTPYLHLTVISICIVNFSGLINAVNYSKMWITKNWIAIPFTVLLQIFLLKYYPPLNFEQVMYYAIMTALPTFLLNIFFCIKGVRNLQDS
jgi:hypothetical protein